MGSTNRIGVEEIVSIYSHFHPCTNAWFPDVRELINTMSPLVGNVYEYETKAS